MKYKKLSEYFWKGRYESFFQQLYLEDNWTPLYIYLHVSRLIIGYVLGISTGIFIALMSI